MSYEDLHINEIDNFLKQDNVIVIDVRDIHSFRAEHIKGAVHIDGPTMGNLIRQRKNNPAILIYCYHGNLSRDVASMVSGFGFTNVSHLVGGWEAWTHHQQSAESRQPESQPAFDMPLADAFA